MPKAAIVSSQGTSDWVSCQSISNNLLKSYEMLPGLDFSRILFSDSMSDADHWHTAQAIAAEKFDTVFFIDHSPHPGIILKKLNEINPNYKPDLVIHIYGDFILHCEKWMEISSLLSTFKVHFIVASEKQKKIVDKMLKGNEYVDIVPFPIDSSKFYFDSNIRNEMRNKFQLEANEKAILYTGRLSAQKNIIDLLHVFETVERNFYSETKLFLAGPVDDIGLPYFGKMNDVGHYNYYLQYYIGKLFPKNKSKKIIYLGNLSSDELFKVYNMADVFFSLSTHHDEDYGMAPAEALMTGLPVVLSEWGGYAGFLNYFKRNSYTVKTKFSETKATADLNMAVKQLVLSLTREEFSRNDLRAEANKKLSIEATTQLLKAYLEHPRHSQFQGFNDFFMKVVQAFKIDPISPFGDGPKASHIYLDVYHDYGS